MPCIFVQKGDSACYQHIVCHRYSMLDFVLVIPIRQHAVLMSFLFVSKFRSWKNCFNSFSILHRLLFLILSTCASVFQVHQIHVGIVILLHVLRLNNIGKQLIFTEDPLYKILEQLFKVKSSLLSSTGTLRLSLS